jgi:hypothetical protein
MSKPTAMSSSMTFAQTFTLASQVRSKLTREASSPKSSLRNLVVQANMLDNIMDYISDETSRRAASKASRVATKAAATHVHFEEPKEQIVSSTSITEYEVGSDSDDDSDYDSESDEDDYYYYSDDEDDVTEELAVKSSFKQMPSLNLSLIEEEEEEEDVIESTPRSYGQDIVMTEVADATHDMPELCRSTSLSDDDEELADKSNYTHEQVHGKLPHAKSPHNTQLQNKSTSSNKMAPSLFSINNDHRQDHHHRQNAIYSMEDMF